MSDPNSNQLETPSYAFKSDSPLWYNVGEWGARGYGIPNPGANHDTVNEDIEEFVREGGKRISVIMHNPNTALSDPPPWNDVDLMIKFMNRTRQVLIGRAVAETESEFRGTHVQSPRQPLLVFPCPCFRVTNNLFRQFVRYSFAVLSELMQSPETVKSHDITEGLANRCVSYVARLQKRIAMEYFGMSEEEAGATTLNLLDHRARYTPRAHGMVDAEAFDLIGSRQLSLPQPRELGPLAEGVLVRDLPPSIGLYPYGGETMSGSANVTGSEVTTSLPPFPASP